MAVMADSLIRFLLIAECSSTISFFDSSLQGTERDYDRAAEAYMHAKSQSNAQAMFNLGYMHEHGQGLPLDLHLAKRYYDQALEVDPAAKLPVSLALASLWIRRNYANSLLVSLSSCVASRLLCPFAFPIGM